MKNNLTRILRSAFVTFAALTLFVNCQKDDDHALQGPIVATDHAEGIELKKITLNELQQISQLKPSLNLIEKKFDHHKKGNTGSKLNVKDNSFVILTDEVLHVKTSNSEAFTFRTKTPVHPYAGYENFIIEKMQNEWYKFYIYAYRDLFINGELNPYVISIAPVENDLINMDGFEENLSAKAFLVQNCIFNDNSPEPVFCFGSGGGGNSGGVSGGGTGGSGGGGGSGYGSWTYSNPDGVGNCIRTRSVTDDNGNIWAETEFNVPCPGDNGGSPNGGSGSGNGSGNGNGGSSGGSGGGTSGGNGDEGW